MASQQTFIAQVPCNLNLSSVLLLGYFSLNTAFIISLLPSKIYSGCPLGQVQKNLLDFWANCDIHFIYKTLFFTSLSKLVGLSWFPYFLY